MKNIRMEGQLMKGLTCQKSRPFRQLEVIDMHRSQRLQGGFLRQFQSLLERVQVEARVEKMKSV